jgi:hypothetical protein
MQRKMGDLRKEIAQTVGLQRLHSLAVLRNSVSHAGCV